MYKIIIVDDEPAIRKGLVNLMPWDSLDCIVVAAAVDGIEAMELLKTEKPDIVITDIKMPGMNGLELSKHIYENYPAIKTIILTAYSDFDYSQSAIKYGAIDFILKPTSTDKFIEAIEKAKLMIHKERENKITIENLKTELSHQIQDIQESFLLKIMHGIEADPIKINNKCESLQIQLENYLSITAQINFHGHGDNQVPSNSNHAILLTKKLLVSIFIDYVHYPVIIDQHHVCIFLNIPKDNASQTIENIISACHELIYMAKNLNKLDLLLGVSQCHNDLSSVSTAYEESLAALSNHFYSNNDIYIFKEEKNNRSSLELKEIEQYITQITELVRSGKYYDTLDVLNKIFILHKSTTQSIENTKNAMISLYSLIIGLLPQSKLSSSNIFLLEKNVCTQIWESGSLDDLYKIFSSAVRTIISNIEPADTHYPSIIEKIDEYITNHYHENINLSTIANFVYLNSSYLSRLYKKETNITLTEKITNIRMEKAKILLKTTNLKIYEIADLVGIENSTYFSILFNKYTGHYPKEYRSLS